MTERPRDPSDVLQAQIRDYIEQLRYASDQAALVAENYPVAEDYGETDPEVARREEIARAAELREDADRLAAALDRPRDRPGLTLPEAIERHTVALLDRAHSSAVSAQQLRGLDEDASAQQWYTAVGLIGQADEVYALLSHAVPGVLERRLKTTRALGIEDTAVPPTHLIDGGQARHGVEYHLSRDCALHYDGFAGNRAVAHLLAYEPSAPVLRRHADELSTYAKQCRSEGDTREAEQAEASARGWSDAERAAVKQAGTVVIVGDFDDNHATSVTNAIEAVATSISDRLGHDHFRLIQYSRDTSGFAAVELQHHPPSPRHAQAITTPGAGTHTLHPTHTRFGQPSWDWMSAHDVGRLIGTEHVEHLIARAGANGEYTRERILSGAASGIPALTQSDTVGSQRLRAARLGEGNAGVEVDRER